MRLQGALEMFCILIQMYGYIPGYAGGQIDTWVCRWTDRHLGMQVDIHVKIHQAYAFKISAPCWAWAIQKREREINGRSGEDYRKC